MFPQIDLAQYDGLYTTDEFGNVYDAKGKPVDKGRDGAYKTVRLKNLDGKWNYVLVHRLVYHQQVEPIPPGMTIDHEDDRPLNNSISNLQLLTQAENSRKAAKRRAIKGDRCVKMTNSKREAASQMWDDGYTVREIAEKYNVNVTTIRAILAGNVLGFNGNTKYIEAAKKRTGHPFGKWSDEDKAEAIRLFQSGETQASISRLTGMSSSTVGRLISRYRKQLKQQQKEAVACG